MKKLAMLTLGLLLAAAPALYAQRTEDKLKDISITIKPIEGKQLYGVKVAPNTFISFDITKLISKETIKDFIITDRGEDEYISYNKTSTQNLTAKGINVLTPTSEYDFFYTIDISSKKTRDGFKEEFNKAVFPAIMVFEDKTDFQNYFNPFKGDKKKCFALNSEEALELEVNLKIDEDFVTFKGSDRPYANEPGKGFFVTNPEDGSLVLVAIGLNTGTLRNTKAVPVMMDRAIELNNFSKGQIKFVDRKFNKITIKENASSTQKGVSVTKTNRDGKKTTKQYKDKISSVDVEKIKKDIKSLSTFEGWI